MSEGGQAKPERGHRIVLVVASLIVIIAGLKAAAPIASPAPGAGGATDAR